MDASSGTAAGSIEEPAATCPVCSATVDASARFCGACGARLDASPAPSTAVPAGQRRQLAILFCDLVDSTSLSEALDPEDLGEIVLAYQEMGRETVVRFGGAVAQYLGDGLLAHFGYPVAHEDDAGRAALAGLAILGGLERLNDAWSTRHGVRLRARVGIHAGPTIVGAMGSSDRSDTSAFGSTPNIAARLEGFAQPGTVVVSDEVRKRLGTRFVLDDLGTTELKGLSSPLQVWQVTGTVATGASRAASSLPLVGRASELALVTDALDHARRGEPRSILVCGEPGIGKSRLLQALHDEVDDEPHGWIEGQCSELTQASPLAPVVELLRNGIGLDQSLGNQERESRLRAALAPLGSRANATTAYLADLLGVELHGHVDDGPASDEGPELRRRRTLTALVDWTARLASERLTVVVIEDLHWSDPTTLELIAELSSGRTPGRLLCVFTTRPGPHYPWFSGSGAIRLDLSPISASESLQLAHELAVDRGIADDVLAQVVERGEGIPLFLEELVRSVDEVADRGPDGVPQTLQAVLTARLDRLGAAREVAQAASVLGREFPLQLLHAVSRASPEEVEVALGELREAGILETHSTAMGVSCVFRHALIVDAAYGTLLRAERRALHLAAADALRDQLPSTVERTPELLAHHLSGADRPLESAEWFERAGRQAAQRAALAEALAHLRRALEELTKVPPSTELDERLLSSNILIGNVLMGSSGMSSDEALQAWEAAIDAAERLGNVEELTSALNGAAVYHADRADTREATALAERILAVATETSSRVAALRAHGTLGMIRFYQGDGDRALAHLETALAASREGDFFSVTYGIGHDEETYFHVVASWVQWWLGWPDRALETARNGLALALRIPSSLSQAMARHGLATAHHLRGECDEAADVARDNIAVCDELGFPFWGGLSRALLGTQQAVQGDPVGVDVVSDGLDRLVKIGNLGGAAFGMVFLAEAYLGAGRHDDAIGAAELGIVTGASIGQPFCDADLLCLKGRGHAAAGRDEPARQSLEESLAVSRRMGARSSGLRSSIALAELLGDVEPDRAASLLDDAVRSMRDGATTTDQRRASALLSRLRTAR